MAHGLIRQDVKHAPLTAPLANPPMGPSSAKVAQMVKS